MTSKLVAIALVLGATGAISMNLANAAPATGGAAPSSPGFGQMDTNSDGFLHKAEAAAHKEMSTQMDKLDTDKDGKLNEAEFGAFSKGSTGGRAGLGTGGGSPSQ
jgi:hypothetical protein